MRFLRPLALLLASASASATAAPVTVEFAGSYEVEGFFNFTDSGDTFALTGTLTYDDDAALQSTDGLSATYVDPTASFTVVFDDANNDGTAVSTAAGGVRFRVENLGGANRRLRVLQRFDDAAGPVPNATYVTRNAAQAIDLGLAFLYADAGALAPPPSFSAVTGPTRNAITSGRFGGSALDSFRIESAVATAVPEPTTAVLLAAPALLALRPRGRLSA